MTKKLFFIFIILGFILILAPFEVEAAYLKFAEYTRPYVIEKETYLFDDTQTNQIGTMEGLSYNDTTNTLIVENFAKQGNLIIEDMGDLNVKIAGDNKIEIEHHAAIDFDNTNLIFSGSGTLTLKAGWGILGRDFNNHIEISDNFTGNLNIESETYNGINFQQHEDMYDNEVDNLIIKNGNINIDSSSLGIEMPGNINIYGGNIKINSKDEGIIARKINISDGFIEVNSQEDEAIIFNDINLSESLTYNGTIDSGYFVDDEGNKIKNLIIEIKKYTVTIEPVENATITPNSTIDNVLHGSNLDITIKTDKGYKVTSIKVNDIEQNISSFKDIFTLENIKEDINIIVKVKKVGTRVSFIANTENQKFVIGEDKTLLFGFETDAEVEIYAEIFVDGNKLSNNDFSWGFAEGMSYYPSARLSEEFMSTMPEGKHNIKFVFDNGLEAETTFTVVKNENTGTLIGGKVTENNENNEDTGNINDSKTNSLQTGDNILLFVGLLIISVVGIFTTTKFRKNAK